MSTTIEELGGLKRRFVVKVPPETFKSKVDKELNRLANQARAKGFRRGKMPLAEVKRRFASAILEQVAHDIMPDCVQSVFKEESIEAIGRPSIKHEIAGLNDPITFSVEFEVHPDVNLAKLRKIKVDKLEAKVTPKQINDIIERLRRQHAQWKPSDQPAQEGDRLKVDFNGTINGEPFKGGKAEGASIELGNKHWLPDLEAGLIGAQAGQSLDIQVTFPDSYPADLSGKTALFSVTVHSIESPELPELTSAFISSLGVEGEEPTVGMLRENIKEKLEKEAEQASNKKVREAVVNAFLKQYSFPLPESAVEEKMEEMQKALKESEAQGGFWEDEKSLREEAENKVAESLLLYAVMKKYNIEVDSERVKKYIAHLSLSLPSENRDKLYEWLANNKKEKANIESTVLEEQIIEKLLEEVTVKVKTVDFDEVMGSPTTI